MFKHFHKKEDDLHIRILRYALENPGFSHEDLLVDLNLDENLKIFVLDQVSPGREFFCIMSPNTGHVKDNRYMLSFEGRSRLLEYDELKEARENAHNASVLAMWALIMSGVGVFISFVGVLVQLYY